MAKSIGNLFFTISADAAKFDATVQRTQKKVHEFEKGTVKGQKNVQAESKKMSLGFAAAAGAAAAFAFELIKSSELAQFAMGAASDAVEAGVVGSVQGIATGFAEVNSSAQETFDGFHALGERNFKKASESFKAAGGDLASGFVRVALGGLDPLLQSVGVDLPGAARGLGETIGTVASQITGSFIFAGDSLKNAWDGAMLALGGAWDTFTGTLKHGWDGFTGWLSDAWDGLQWAGQHPWEALQAAWGAFTTWLGDAWTSLTWAGDTAWNALQGAWSGFTTWLGDAWGNVTWAGNVVWDAIKGAWSTFTGWLSDSWDNFWKGVTGGSSSGGSPKKYQSGGYVSSTGLAYLHAGEYVTPANQVNNYNQRSMTVPQIVVNVSAPQGFSFGGGVALGMDTHAAVTDAMRGMFNL